MVMKVLRLKHQKDAVGARIMLQMSQPRRPRKGEDPSEIHYHDDPERFEQLCRYNRIDVEVEREAYGVLPPLSPAEQARWQLDQGINDRGIPFDRPLIAAALEITKATRPEIDAELATITEGVATAATQVARLQAWLRQQGLEIETLDKKAIAKLLAGELASPVRRALELRRAGGQAAARKLDTLLHCLDADDRARGLFRYHGASTGRWTGHRFQPQNLKRTQTDDIDAAVAVISTGDYDKVRAQFPDPLAVAGDIMRATICAAPGKVLIGADLSLIEMRVLAWLAGEEKELDIYRRFDATGDPHDDPYLITASWIFRVPVEAVTAEQRQPGKFATLAFQYQGGLRAFRRIAPDSGSSDQEIERFKLAWRAAHPNIERFWFAIDRAAVAAVRRPNEVVRCGRIAAVSNGSFLFLVLPSGRELAYPNPRLIEDRDHGRYVVEFKDNAAGQWRDDPIARDLLAEAMLRVEAAGYPIVLHIHDEIVAEVPEGFAPARHFR
jgi:DNA polymerase family A